MDHSANDHGEQHDIHLPDPSIWPLIVGFTALVLGAALIFYSHDRDNQWAGPLLGAAFMITVVSACGWAYEDGRMKKKAEAGDHSKPRNARYTQVVTFAIPEGEYAASRQEGGVISQLESRDSALRDLDGFQDLRVIVSPAESGASQVLVETTWADRERLATYEETRKTMLDILSQAGTQVAPGSVQVFDMEVVRDTKEASFTFGLGPMVATFGALIVGGFMVGAGLNLFSSDKATAGTGGEGGGPSAPADNVITAKGTKFTTGTTITAPPNTKITLVFDNQDTSPPHNVQIFAGSQASGGLLKGCTAGCEGDEVSLPLKGGPERIEFTFTTPAVGEYAFDCVAHPTQMTGKLIIKDGAPVPGSGGGASAGGGGASSGTQVILAKGTKFTKGTTINATANTPITVEFDNEDTSPPHNVQIFAGSKNSGPLLKGCTAGCDGDEVSLPLKGGPEKISFTFTAPGPGEYAFDCAAHPNEMKGKLVVK